MGKNGLKFCEENAVLNRIFEEGNSIWVKSLEAVLVRCWYGVGAVLVRCLFFSFWCTFLKN